MQHFLFAGALLGISAVWLVPWISGALKGIVPSSVAAYLPSEATPTNITSGVVSALVYGSFLLLVLIVLKRFGVKAEARGVTV